MNFNRLLEKKNEQYLPNLSTDIVIIGYDNHLLKCLLLKVGKKWMLPGGFVKKDKSVEEAAQSVLKYRPGLENPHLKFLSVFGDSDRQFKEVWKIFIEKRGRKWKEDYWVNNRFVSLVYYSLVNIEETHPQVGQLDEAFGWFDMDDLPAMWMDHKAIVHTARAYFKQDMLREHLTYNLLPTEFTMPQLHQLHQVILQEKIDRSRFQKKMIASGKFERLLELQKNTPGRNPYKYRVKMVPTSTTQKIKTEKNR